jgi:zinc resistance-associated protein
VESTYCRHHHADDRRLDTRLRPATVSSRPVAPCALTADDIAAFTDARIAALKTALKLTPAQEKNWPAVEQALRDISKERLARRAARAAGQPIDATERLRERADALTARASALRRLADAEKPLYQSLDDAQKRRFSIALRFAARRHMAEHRWHG